LSILGTAYLLLREHEAGEQLALCHAVNGQKRQRQACCLAQVVLIWGQVDPKPLTIGRFGLEV
jgi:hypothetical protein